MTWINRLVVYFGMLSIIAGSSITVSESFNILKGNSGPIHATPHITNIIRNGTNDLSDKEKNEISSIGLEIKFGQIESIVPNDLDQIYDSDHFRIFYTLEGSDAVENLDYVVTMSQIFEQVYSFFTDTLGYDPPPPDPESNHNLYEIYVENLPTYYFGITYTTNANITAPACVSYIRMRNNYSGSQFSDHTELENIKVTAVHEFFHSIQFGYNCYERLWFMEATAVWSEDELYNGINDLYRYLPSWFSNPDKPIDHESNHMYGTFIYFQYIDEHLGGPETIKTCWENSNNMASQVQDISFNAIDAALLEQNSSFEDTYVRMRIANRILSQNAGIYSYVEAEGYKSAANIPPEQYISFQKGDDQSINNQSLDLNESIYYSLVTSNPVKIDLFTLNEKVILSSIIKHQDSNQWTIRSNNEINIDTELKIEWISLIVSALGREKTDWGFTLLLSDGYSEDFTFYQPYPNPSFGESIFIDLQVINNQTISTTIFDVMGRRIWTSSNSFTEPEFVTLVWNGTNTFGRRVSNGVYFIKAEGKKMGDIHKIILLKNK